VGHTWLHGRVKRTILAGCALVLTAACGASGGGTPAGQPARAPVVAPGERVGVPAQAQPAAPAPTPAQAPPAQQISPQPIRPLPTSPPASGSGPAERDGVPPCPMGSNPPLHKICPL